MTADPTTCDRQWRLQALLEAFQLYQHSHFEGWLIDMIRDLRTHRNRLRFQLEQGVCVCEWCHAFGTSGYHETVATAVLQAETLLSTLQVLAGQTELWLPDASGSDEASSDVEAPPGSVPGTPGTAEPV